MQTIGHLLVFMLFNQKISALKLSHRIAFLNFNLWAAWQKSRVDFILCIFHPCNEKRSLLHFHIWKNLPRIRAADLKQDYYSEVILSIHITSALKLCFKQWFIVSVVCVCVCDILGGMKSVWPYVIFRLRVLTVSDVVWLYVSNLRYM